MLDIESELVRLLMRIGYQGAWNGLYKDALSVFEGVGAVRPDSEIPFIGAAAVAMLSGNYDVAVQVLNQGALARNPDSDLALAHLGCAKRMQGSDDEGKAILLDVAENSENPEARQLATNLLALSREKLTN
jgi:hypothetical protein